MGRAPRCVLVVGFTVLALALGCGATEVAGPDLPGTSGDAGNPSSRGDGGSDGGGSSSGSSGSDASSSSGGARSCKRGGAPEIWVAHGQSNIQGESKGGGEPYTPGLQLPNSVAMEFKVKTGMLVNYDETQGGIGEFDIPGFGVVHAASKRHSVYYRFAQRYNELTQAQVIAAPAYRGATAITQPGAAAAGPPEYWMSTSWKGFAAATAKIAAAKTKVPGAPVYVLLYAGEYDAFALNNGSLTKDGFKALLKTHVEAMFAQWGATAIYAGIMHKMKADGAFDGALEKLAQAQAELAAEMSAFHVVTDTRTSLAAEAFHHPGDYIHLNETGMDALGQALAEGTARAQGCLQ